MKLGSLFDGIGGWLISAKRNGITPVWASEVERFPIEVTKYHHPEVMHLGDITKLDGAKIEPVDIITSGSPCQNLSVAGNGKGLAGDESGLFYESTRLLREMRTATNGQYPRFYVWENVCGAYSSNKGRDFCSVLESLTETHIPMPESGRWANAGMVRSRRCDVAWRTLDAQYWGVPQRRKRIFLVADFAEARDRKPEVFFEPEGLPGHSPQGRETREGFTEASDGRTGKTGVLSYDMTHADDVIRLDKTDKVHTLKHRMGTGGNNVPLVQVFANSNFGGFKSTQVAQTIKRCSGNCGSGSENLISAAGMVRRLTPLECERLMGLPDGYTDIPGASDTARYRAIGNGMAIPCSDFVMSVVRRMTE